MVPAERPGADQSLAADQCWTRCSSKDANKHPPPTPTRAGAGMKPATWAPPVQSRRRWRRFCAPSGLKTSRAGCGCASGKRSRGVTELDKHLCHGDGAARRRRNRRQADRPGAQSVPVLRTTRSEPMPCSEGPAHVRRMAC